MSINDSATPTTPPAGFTPAPGFYEDGPTTLWVNEAEEVNGTLCLDTYWEPGKGFVYGLGVADKSAECKLSDLKAALTELEAFIRRAELNEARQA